MTEEKKSAGAGKVLKVGCLLTVGVIVLLIVIGAIVGDTKDESETKPVATLSAEQAPAEAAEPASEPTSSLTGPQNNAVRSATQYLSISGFSRQGLIDQLSSDAGDAYAVSDATAAVDSLAVDWNEQAVRSAKQYLDISGFSCNGLIDQLSSDAGDKYTKSEATFGAEQAGAC